MMKILIVDDDFSNLSILTTLLENSGYTVDSALNGEEALYKLRSDQFDLIISDILMPVMDGYKLSQICKEDDQLRHIPIIINTGTYIDEKDEQIALRFGAEAYLRKPYDQKTLIKTVEQVFENVRSGKIKTGQAETAEESGVYKLYSERLVNKLEKKMQELDKEKMALEMEVAERKKIEDRLRKSRDYAESLFNMAPSIMLIMDTEGRILRLNPYMEKISGYTLEEVQGKKWKEIFSPENGNQSITDFLEKVDENREPVGNLSTIMTKEGNRREIIWYDRPLRDNDGRLFGLLAVGQDITDQLMMQRNLFRAKKVEAMGSFAGGIAQDFNSLLTLILGNISLIQEDVEPGSEASECLTQARDATFRAKEMASRLMLFARGRDPVKIPSYIGSIVWEAVRSAIRVFKIQCEFIIPEDLLPVDIDPWLMKHALHNISLNAVEAMKGRGSLLVKCENKDFKDNEIVNRPAGKYVVITIQDHGPGISKENLAKIFAPDFSTKDTGLAKGLGLGLSVVFSIIEKHDGVIHVTSEPGTGTCVNLYLPASFEKVAVPDARSVAELSGQTPGRGEKILVIEDEESLRRMLKIMLNRLGYDPVVTATGDEALKSYRKSDKSDEPFEAVIVDMSHIFSISGETTIRKIRESNPELPIIVCSGYPNDPIVADFKAHGFSGVIIKPFTLDELKHLMTEIFR